MPDYYVINAHNANLFVIVFVAVVSLLAILVSLRRKRKQAQSDNKRKGELSKFFKLDIIDPAGSKGPLKTIEVTVTLPKGEKCSIQATDDLYDKSNFPHSSGYVPSFRSLEEQKVIEDGATVKKISQKFEIKSATRTKIRASVADWRITLAERTAFVQPQ